MQSGYSSKFSFSPTSQRPMANSLTLATYTPIGFDPASLSFFGHSNLFLQSAAGKHGALL
jgi:hypothetical protein